MSDEDNSALMDRKEDDIVQHTASTLSLETKLIFSSCMCLATKSFSTRTESRTESMASTQAWLVTCCVTVVLPAREDDQLHEKILAEMDPADPEQILKIILMRNMRH